jgi:hypothetical protein
MLLEHELVFGDNLAIPHIVLQLQQGSYTSTAALHSC